MLVAHAANLSKWFYFTLVDPIAAGGSSFKTTFVSSGLVDRVTEAKRPGWYYLKTIRDRFGDFYPETDTAIISGEGKCYLRYTDGNDNYLHAFWMGTYDDSTSADIITVMTDSATLVELNDDDTLGTDTPLTISSSQVSVTSKEEVQFVLDNGSLLQLPEDVPSFTATADGQTTIDLAWNNPNNHEVILDFSLNQTAWTNLVDGAQSTSFSHTSLSAGTQYFYRIKFRNEAGVSASYVTANAQTADSSVVIPAPTVFWDDDFSVQYPEPQGYYNFQSQGTGDVEPSYTTDGPGGSETLFCPLPATGAERSEIAFIGNTGFDSDTTLHNVNYGTLYEIKASGNSDETPIICQWHIVDGTVSGGSPLIGLLANYNDNELDIYQDGADNNKPIARWINQDNSVVDPNDFLGKWIKVVIDMRGNHGNRTTPVQWTPGGDQTPDNGTPVAGFRDGFVRIYLTIGTETALPADPTENDLIWSWDGYFGYVATDDHLGYPKAGVYDTSNNSTNTVVLVNRVRVQDEVIVTTNPPGGFNT
jgi:hypothetical protein